VSRQPMIEDDIDDDSGIATQRRLEQSTSVCHPQVPIGEGIDTTVQADACRDARRIRRQIGTADEITGDLAHQQCIVVEGEDGMG